MSPVSIEKFATLCPKGRLLGIDVGSKTLGIALSDEEHLVASPLKTMQRTKWAKDREALQNLLKTHLIQGIVVGLPLHMNGEESRNSQSVRQFATNLLAMYSVPLCLWDERLSTAAVTRSMLEADLSRQKRRERVDQLAASYILQGVLDKMRILRTHQI